MTFLLQEFLPVDWQNGAKSQYHTYGCPEYMEPEFPNVSVILPELQTPSSQMVRETSRLLSYHLYLPLPALCLSFICKTGKDAKNMLSQDYTKMKNNIKEIILLEQSSLKLHQSYFLTSARYLYCKVHTRNTSTKIKLLIQHHPQQLFIQDFSTEYIRFFANKTK